MWAVIAKYAELLGGVGGGVAIQGSAGACKPEELTPKMRAFLESLKPLIELAEKNNSRLAIENHGNSLLDLLDSFKAFVDLNTSPRLGLALAPYHLAGWRRVRRGSHSDLRPPVALLLCVAEPAGDGPTPWARPDGFHTLAAGPGAGELRWFRKCVHARARRTRHHVRRAGPKPGLPEAMRQSLIAVTGAPNHETTNY